jgi:pyruvate/2-oxoglutarate dehydrogenase complex dihydrolipoamide acyltransferase (E2) component
VTAVGPMARERRHTLRFLDYARTFAPVYLDTEVDMTAVRNHRDAAHGAGQRFSWVTYVLHTAGRVLGTHPEANAAMSGRRWPKVAGYDSVDVKVALDKRLNGERVVFSAIVRGAETSSLAEIQERIDRFRDADPATMEELAGARALQRLPWPLSALAFKLAARSLRHRPKLMGTVALTSLGHTAVDGFHSVGGTTITLGAGRVLDRPVVQDARLTVAPTMRLSLAFDHRVLDGAAAAEVLTHLKEALETFSEPVARG